MCNVNVLTFQALIAPVNIWWCFSHLWKFKPKWYMSLVNRQQCNGSCFSPWKQITCFASSVTSPSELHRTATLHPREGTSFPGFWGRHSEGKAVHVLRQWSWVWWFHVSVFLSRSSSILWPCVRSWSNAVPTAGRAERLTFTSTATETPWPPCPKTGWT